MISLLLMLIFILILLMILLNLKSHIDINCNHDISLGINSSLYIANIIAKKNCDADKSRNIKIYMNRDMSNTKIIRLYN